MSGTKFKVKKFTTDTAASTGAVHEFGAEINQDFPIEAPAGASGKLLVNNDLEVGSNLKLGEDNYVSTNRLVYPDTSSIWLEHGSSSGNVAVTLDSRVPADGDTGEFKIIKRDANSSAVVFTVRESGDVETEGNIVLNEDKHIECRKFIYPSTDNTWLEHTTGSGSISLILDSQDKDDTTDGYFRIMDRTSGATITVFKVSEEGTVEAEGNLKLGEDNYVSTNRLVYPDTSSIWLEHGSSSGNVAVTLDSRVPADGDTGEFKIIKRDANSSAVVFTVRESGDVETEGNITLEGNLVLNENNYVATNRLQYPEGGNAWLEHSSSNGNVAISLDRHDSSDSNNSKFKVRDGNDEVFTVDEEGNVEADGYIATGTLQDINNGATNYIKMAESVNEVGLSMRLRPMGNLVLDPQGDVRIGENNSSKLAMYTGQVISCNNFQHPNTLETWLEHGSATGNIALSLSKHSNTANVNSYFYIEDGDGQEVFAVHADGEVYIKPRDSNGDLTTIPVYNDPTGSVEYRLLWDSSNGRVERGTSTFFTEGHFYWSEQALPPGTTVNLVNGTLATSTSANSSICAGIVGFSIEITENSEHKEDSLGVSRTSGHMHKVISIGDTRYKGCQGFNVCNEGGAISAGDLLVTSSTPGYLMKQADDLMRSSTVGKAMENVVFNEQGQASEVYGYLYCG